MNNMVFATGNDSINAELLIGGRYIVRVGGRKAGLIVPGNKSFNGGFEYWPNSNQFHCDGEQHSTVQKCLDYIA